VAADRARGRYEELTPRARRRLLGKSLIRATLSTVLLVVLYYWLPLDGAIDNEATVVLVVGLIAFGYVVARQVRSIVESAAPRLRAIEVLFTLAPFFILLFAGVYFAIAHTTPGSFTEPLSRTDSIYFTVTVFATVGFGDIAPVTATTRIIVTVQMLADLVLLGAGLKMLLGAVQMGLKRQSVGVPDAGGAQAGADDTPAD
jgi:voltage-gated potassium channel